MESTIETRRIIAVFARLGLMAVALSLTVLFSGPARAAEPSSPDVYEAPSGFDCPPRSGIYPEPDPCVSTPAPPDDPAFSSRIDAIPRSPDWYCDPVTKPGVAEFRRLLVSTYGFGGNTSRDCDVTWGYEYSLHKMGLALDWRIDTTDTAEWSTGLSFIRWLLASDEEGNEFAMARRIGVTQLIWHNRVWRTADPTWRIYCDPRDATDARCITNPTSRHDDHMHISFSLEAGYFHTSYFQTLGFTPLPIPPPPVPEEELPPTPEAELPLGAEEELPPIPEGELETTEPVNSDVGEGSVTVP